MILHVALLTQKVQKKLRDERLISYVYDLLVVGT